MTGCLFCAIAAGGQQAHVVLESEHAIAFLDHRPVFPGHCLLVPRVHVETLPELPEERVEPIFLDVRRLARAVEQALEAQGTFVAINNKVSQSVPHLHVHVVPRRFKDGLKGFFWPRVKYSGPDEMAAVRDRIHAVLAG
jgi:histidine triad (HIT) family protein